MIELLAVLVLLAGTTVVIGGMARRAEARGPRARAGRRRGLARLDVGDSRVLEELTAQLEEPDDDVFDALAAVGTVREVQPLRAVADGHMSIGRISRGATRAIRAIQSRLEGAEAGSLAVADVGAGALSEAEPRDLGRLSQAKRERN